MRVGSIAVTNAVRGTSDTTGEPTDTHFWAVMKWLKQQGHTGPIMVHMLHGDPKTVDLPREPQRILLDR